MATEICINIDFCNGLLCDDTKPLTDLPSARSSDIHLRAISEEIPQPSVTKITTYLYLIPVDPVSQVFLRSYTYAAEALTEEGIHALAVINCFDWTDVCGKHNITGYPTIRVYRKDHDFVTYQGMLEEKAVKDTIKV